jgi:hypothetical protein
MIHADIQGKTGVPEDVLTSCCLGLLRLLPDDNLIELLTLSCHHDGRKLDLTGLDTVCELEFWPWLRDGGAPDAIATLNSNSTSRRAKIVIEVKHGAGKSGGDEDQLVKYYNAAVRQHKNYGVFLVYLTHHRDMPMADLEASLACLTDDAEIYWLNWYTVARWAGDKLHGTQLSVVESRVLSTINNYLSLKGYRRFEQLDTVPWEPIGASVYMRSYIGIEAALKSCCGPVYKRTYLNSQKLSTVTCLYRR